MRMAALGDVVELVMGQAPSGDTYNNSGVGLPLIAGASDFGEENPSPSRFTSAPSKRSIPGDIILCIRATIGDLNWSDKEYCLGRGVAALRPKNGSIDPRYLWRVLEVNSARLADKGRGATFKQVTRSDIAELAIPFPPLEDQKRIARILDQADSLRRLRQRAIDRLNTLGQAIFYEMFCDPDTKKQWKLLALTDFFDFRTGKLDSNASVPNGKYPFFTCSRENYWIDEYAFDCEALLLAGNNANADYSVKRYRGKFNAYQRTYVLNLKDQKSSYAYAEAALERKLNELKHVSIGTNTKYLTMGIFRQLKVLVPPYGLQFDFEKRMSKIKPQIEVFENAKNKIDLLFSALQQRAFCGNL